MSDTETPSATSDHHHDPNAPIRVELDLPVSQSRAFDAYVHGITEWWHPRYTANPVTFESISIDPNVDGVVAEHHVHGEVIEWGHVVDVENGERIAYTTSLGHDGDPTLITVEFTHAHEGGTHVVFEHSGWNESNASARGTFTEWRRMLDRYAAIAERV